MKNKLLLFLFMLGSFILGISSIKAIDITCGSTECVESTFDIVQLTSTNTGTSGTYKNYVSYFQSYYQSNTAYMYAPGCSQCTNSLMSGGATSSFSWSSDSGYFSGLFGGNLSDGLCINSNNAVYGTYRCYSKAGTYAFLVKQTAVSTGVEPDKTEYIVYVNVKSDLTIGSIAARRIKNAEGQIIPEEKVTELSYGLTGVFPTKPESIYNVEADFYVSNVYAYGYAEYTTKAVYYVNVSTASANNPITAKIYDKNGFVRDVVFNKPEVGDIGLESGQVLVFPRYSLDVGTQVGVMFYGMQGSGLFLDTLSVYKPSLKKSQNGIVTTTTNVQNGFGGGYNQSKATVVTLGGSGKNYLEYTWTYDESLVPDAGVIIKVLPYVVVVGVVLVAGLLLILTRRKKETDITE